MKGTGEKEQFHRSKKKRTDGPPEAQRWMSQPTYKGISDRRIAANLPPTYMNKDGSYHCQARNC